MSPIGPACKDWTPDEPLEMQSGDCPHDSCWTILTHGRITKAQIRWNTP